VGSADAMLKAAEVVLAAYETIGAGLCTAIVRGSVANVAMALDVGMVEAERIGELHAVMLVPRPLDDLDQTLPLASCWIEEMQPLKIPLAVKETERETIALPELRQEMKELTVQNNDRLLPEALQPEAQPFTPEIPLEQPLEIAEPAIDAVELAAEIETDEASNGSTPDTPKRRQIRRRDRRK